MGVRSGAAVQTRLIRSENRVHQILEKKIYVHPFIASTSASSGAYLSHMSIPI